MNEPAIALEPLPDFTPMVEAIEAGGGRVVPPAEADGLVWIGVHDPDGLRSLLAEHPNIRWVQLPLAGIEEFVDVLDDSRTWTCAKVVYADEVAEHALALTLGGMRRIAQYARADSWTPTAGTNLLGARVVILGGGGIAESFIRLIEPFGCHTTVLRRSGTPTPGADVTTTLEDLHRSVADADVVLLALALTADTAGVVDAAALDAMAERAWLINVARGAHVDTDALVEALRTGSIAGAALDVVDPEPLPDGHPLWSLPNVIITPHTANTPQMAQATLGAHVTANVARFGRGEPLLGLVDVDAGF